MKHPGYIEIALAWWLVLFSLPALAGGLPKPVSTKPEAQKLIDQAWDLSHHQSDEETYRQCVALMEKADQLDSNNDTILTDLARYLWNYGDRLPKQTKEQQKQLDEIYARGMAAAEKSMDLKETVGGHYWYGVNKAAGLEFTSIFSQVAGFPGVLKHSDWVKAHDPDYYYGAPGREWSEILVRVPKMAVKLVGWDPQQVVDEINTSIKRQPLYLDNYIFKARFIYTYYGNQDEALQLLEQTLPKDPAILPDEITANLQALRQGRELWKKITGKDYPAK